MKLNSKNIIKIFRETKILLEKEIKKQKIKSYFFYIPISPRLHAKMCEAKDINKICEECGYWVYSSKKLKSIREKIDKELLKNAPIKNTK